MEKNGAPTIHAPDRAAWREWLEENHRSEKSVWLIVYHRQSTLSQASSNYCPNGLGQEEIRQIKT